MANIMGGTKNFFLATIAVALVAAAAPTASTCSTVGQNVLSNPGFEASTNSISPWVLDSGTSGFVTDPGEHSANALAIPVKQDLSTGLQPGFGQWSNVSCDEYLFAVDYRFSQPGPRTGLSFYVLTGNSSTRLSEQSNTTWTTLEEYQLNPALIRGLAHLNVAPLEKRLAYNNEILFDNVRLVAAGDVVYKSGAQEAIKNGGFESGDLSPWYSHDNTGYPFTVVSPGLSGSKYGVAIGAAGGGSGSLSQNVTLTPGSHYEFSFRYNWPIAAPDSFFGPVGFHTSGGNAASLTGPVRSDFAGAVITGGSGTFSRRFVAHGRNTNITVTFSSENGTVHVTADNFSIKEVQPPTVA